MERRGTRSRRPVVGDEQIETASWQLDIPGPSTATPAVYGRGARNTKSSDTKRNEVFKGQQEEEVVTEEEVAENEEDEESDSDSDDSDEGTYFIDPSGNYYYQATPDSEPVLSAPPKGKYVPEDETGKTGDDAGISYMLIVDDPEPGDSQKDGLFVVPKAENIVSKANVYHVGDGNNILIEEVESEAALLTEEVELPLKKEARPSRTRAPKSNASPVKVDGEFHCTFCSYVTTKKHLLGRHMKCHSEERPFTCSVCERGFKTVASLNNHVNTHTGNKPHACKYCETSFATSGELVRHVRYKHTMEKPHKCPDCDYASVELSKLRRHIRCHTGERPFQCPHCTYASPDMFKLKRHIRIHTGEKPYECNICKARFTQSNSLKAHKLIHNVANKPVFACEFCPATCGRKADLRIHIAKLHTADTPFPCKKCTETFPDRYTYKIHLKTHEGEKCYKCEFCDYKASNLRHMESHCLIHTNEKPFECEHCDQSFRQKQLLRRHTNLYHNPNYVAPQPKEKANECPTCHKGFHHKGNLIRHMAVHESSSPGGEERKSRTRLGEIEFFGYAEHGVKDELEVDEDEEELEEDEDLEDTIEEELMETELGGEILEHQDADGNRYVVLEVINNEVEEIHVAV